GQCSDGSRGAVVLCHEKESWRRPLLSGGDERAAHLGTAVPGQCSASLMDGNRECATAAYGEHGDDATQRPAHNTDPLRIGERQRAEILECREHVIGLLLQPCNEPL